MSRSVDTGAPSTPAESGLAAPTASSQLGASLCVTQWGSNRARSIWLAQSVASIVEDLITRVAAVEGLEIDGEPADWYAKTVWWGH